MIENPIMENGASVNIGEQRFDRIIEEKRFYVDKTAFIKEWWENGSTVTLITRPQVWQDAEHEHDRVFFLQ